MRTRLSVSARERIRGIEVRSSTIVIALSQRVIAYEYGVGSSVTPSVKGKGKASDGFWLRKIREWETAENENGKLSFWVVIVMTDIHSGLIAISTAPGSTLLAMPGRQAGHVQLVLLPPCPPVSTQAPPSTSQPFRSPIILAHTHALSRLACTATGSHIVTTSERGTLIRVWDTSRGRLERELRRGMDRAEMWGVRPEDAALRDTGDVTNERMSKGGRVVGWSDKGTIHIWLDDPAASIPPCVRKLCWFRGCSSSVSQFCTGSPAFTHSLALPQSPSSEIFLFHRVLRAIPPSKKKPTCVLGVYEQRRRS